jgi:hypothetical protein
MIRKTRIIITRALSLLNIVAILYASSVVFAVLIPSCNLLPSSIQAKRAQQGRKTCRLPLRPHFPAPRAGP